MAQEAAERASRYAREALPPLTEPRAFTRPARRLITPRGSRLIQNSKGAGLQLARRMKAIEYGDVVVVTCLGRLARSTLHLLRTVDAITKTGAQFRSPADSWCDTATAHGKLLLTVLAGLSEFEHSLFVSRIGRHPAGQ
jgi:hypothetical protein